MSLSITLCKYNHFHNVDSSDPGTWYMSPSVYVFFDFFYHYRFLHTGILSPLVSLFLDIFFFLLQWCMGLFPYLNIIKAIYEKKKSDINPYLSNNELTGFSVTCHQKLIIFRDIILIHSFIYSINRDILTTY